jgi:hypothetical protein
MTYLLALSLFLAPTTADWRWDECRFNDGSSTWTSREVRQEIRCATQKWPVPGGATRAIAIALCESGTDLQDAGGDGYAGPFQQSERYWPDRRRHYKPAGWELARNPAHPRANVIVSIRQAHGSGWGAWSCA